ncbi:ABC transporter permease [Desulfopila sp. IMCC35006]|uniref:ABC transporter permease n=1 Tax=Desulfopila sp. IMCC35006 TaxID=2569542 RepID=UPI0010ABA5C0|nr:ABC transporter permease [Desulfopila sp. IMCC35006]TKB23279.1 ABC transporter permease [Desulfopila sp. IMCC35006]
MGNSRRRLQELTFNVGLTALSLLLALVIGAVLFLIAGANPIKAYGVMFTAPLEDIFGITEIFVRAAPLLLVALGISISFRSGILNIGGEGQILVGAIFGLCIALYAPPMHWSIMMPLIFAASFAGGALWGGIAGWMKAYLNVNEILSTVMLNYVAIQIYSYLIRGPMMDKQEIVYGTGASQTARIAREYWLAKLIPGARMHSGMIIAVVLAVIVFFFLWKTIYGYRMRAVGAEIRASRYAGVNTRWYLLLAMLLAGGFAGLAGAVEVLGVHHRGLESISAGYGFSGIVVALFGGLHPLGAIPASIIFGLLIVGADMMQRAVHVPAYIILAIQGLIILAIVSSNVFITKKGMRAKMVKFLGKATGRK